jgi:hypothetical protein
MQQEKERAPVVKGWGKVGSLHVYLETMEIWSAFELCPDDENGGDEGDQNENEAKRRDKINFRQYVPCSTRKPLPVASSSLPNSTRHLYLSAGLTWLAVGVVGDAQTSLD